MKINKKIYSSLLALLLLASCSKREKLSPTEMLQKASGFAAKGEWKQARLLAAEAVDKDPSSAEALLLFAMALEKSGEPEEALRKARKAANLAPDMFMVQYTIGKLLFERAEYDKALSHLRSALKLRPKNTDALVLIAKTATVLNLPEASKYYLALAKSKRFRGRPEAFNELAVFLTKKNRMNAAAKCLTKALKMAPDNPTVVLNLGVFCDKHLKKPIAAKKYYLKYLKLTADNPAYESNRNRLKKRLAEIN